MPIKQKKKKKRKKKNKKKKEERRIQREREIRTYLAASNAHVKWRRHSSARSRRVALLPGTFPPSSLKQVGDILERSNQPIFVLKRLGDRHILLQTKPFDRNITVREVVFLCIVTGYKSDYQRRNWERESHDQT